MALFLISVTTVTVSNAYRRKRIHYTAHAFAIKSRHLNPVMSSKSELVGKSKGHLASKSVYAPMCRTLVSRMFLPGYGQAPAAGTQYQNKVSPKTASDYTRRFYKE